MEDSASERLFADRFRAKKKLRQGLGIETFFGADLRDGGEVIISVARPTILVDGAKARLAYEVAALNRLGGTNDPAPIFLDSDGDVVLLVRRFIQGVTLEERLRNDGALTPAEVVELG